MRRFVLGDVHGRYSALLEVLKKSKFDYKKDKLIVLGDIVDGGNKTFEVVEELLKIKNLVFILGNHDIWFMNAWGQELVPNLWVHQGGDKTLESYRLPTKVQGYVVDDTELPKPLLIPITHQDFFNTGVYYFVEDNMVFVHGGFDPKVPIEKQTKEFITWDRELIQISKSEPIAQYLKVFVGHTTTQMISDVHKNWTKPIKYTNLICMDTGAGWNGKLTIMNIDTEEYWQSKTQKPGEE